MQIYVTLVLSRQGTVSSSASCLQLHKRAERVAAALMGRLNTGDHVALVYPPGKKKTNICCPVLLDLLKHPHSIGFKRKNIYKQTLCAGIDLIATFYGCLYAGCVPVTVRPPHPQNLATTLPTVKMIVEVTQRLFGDTSSAYGSQCGLYALKNTLKSVIFRCICALLATLYCLIENMNSNTTYVVRFYYLW